MHFNSFLIKLGVKSDDFFLAGSLALQPWVLGNLVNVQTLGRISQSHTSDKVEELGITLDVSSSHSVFSALVVLVVVLVASLAEGELGVAHNEQNNSEGKNVNWRTVVGAVVVTDFGSHVLGSSTFSLKFGTLGSSKKLGKTEISELHVDVLV